MIALRIANNMIQNNLLREKNILVSTDSPAKRGFKHISAHVVDAAGANTGKRLTKASSVATYDTDNTRQILKASGGLEDCATTAKHVGKDEESLRNSNIHQGV